MKFLKIRQVYFQFLHITIQNYFLIWISRQTKKKHSPKTMSYSDQSFRFAPPWSTKKWNLGKSGQNKSPVFANGEGRSNSFLKILNCVNKYLCVYHLKYFFKYLLSKKVGQNKFVKLILLCKKIAFSFFFSQGPKYLSTYIRDMYVEKCNNFWWN